MARIATGILTFLLFMAYHPSEPWADLYTWTDSGGVMHSSDNPADVPPAYRKHLKLVADAGDAEGGSVVPFERTKSGLILVEVVLNGVKAKMVLDTGADVVVITASLSKRLNQDLSSPPENIVKLHTNCGEVEGRSLTVDWIALGNARKENVRSVIAPDNSLFSDFDGLLGLSFLGDFKVIVDYQKGQVVLGR